MILSLMALPGCDRGGSGTGLDPVSDCSPANTVSLQVGEAERLSGPGARTLCVGGEAGAEYVLVPHYLASASGDSLTVSFEAEGTAPAIGEPRPFLLPGHHSPGVQGLLEPAPAAHALEDPGPTLDRRLREMERRELLPRVGGGGPAQPPTPASARPAEVAQRSTPPLPAGVPQVGALITLNAQAEEACTNPVARTGEVMAVSDHAIVLADTARPANGFSAQDFQNLATTFDTLVVPVVHRNFGEPTDLDGNGRVILFFTPEVNRLTPAGSTRFVGGFFFARDLFPRVSEPRFQACAASNVGEVLYLLVPDPAGSINSNVRETAVVRQGATATMAHEFQHLVNAARRLHILALPASQAFEEVWLNEGLSHMAEELLFYEASGLEPRRNLDLAALQAGGARVVDAANAHHVPNLNRFRLFLQGPEIRSAYDSVDNLEARGAAQQFLRYAADRRQGSDEAFFRALVDGPQVGWSNLASRLGGEAALRRWYADWSVAIYADERVREIPVDFQLLSWSHPTIFQALGVDGYPIRTRPLTPTGPVSFSLVAGGAAYLRFQVPGPTTARIITSAGESSIPMVFQLTLLRTR
jgi:hypothetical protein